MIDSTIIGLGIAGMVGYKFIDKLLDKFIDSSTRKDFVTQEQFDKYNDKRIQTEDLIKAQLSELRAITLIIAMKTGVKEEEITKLVKG